MAENLEKIICPTRSLFIGVGGVGSDIIKKLTEKCNNTDVTNLRFVVMDTNVNDLRKMRTGTSINIKTIQTSSTQTVGAYLNHDEDAKNKWFPKNSILYNKTVSEGAGQIRAISRLALNATIRQGTIKRLYETLDELFAKDGRDLKQAIRIYIVSTSAGGTGSGIAMEISLLVRNYMEQNYSESNCVIRGLFVLPGVLDTVITSDKERETIRRNGYATIKEINAFMMLGSNFFEVDKRLARYRNLSCSFPVSDEETVSLRHLPFDFCFLLDRLDLNQGNMKSISQYIDYAAQSLFEQNIGPMQGSANSVEDNIIKEAMDIKMYGRNRFGAIGASVMQYPYESIADYVAKSWAIDQIGGDKAIGGWLQYDREFFRLKNEYRKHGGTREEAPARRNVYVDTLKQSESKLSSQLRRVYFGGDNYDIMDKKIKQCVNEYFQHLNTELKKRLEGNVNYILNYQNSSVLLDESHYTNEDNYGKYGDSFGMLDYFASIVENIAVVIGKGAGNSIFWSEDTRIADTMQNYTVESIFKADNGAMHPNAIRAYLYSLFNEFTKHSKDCETNISNAENSIREYGPTIELDMYVPPLVKKKDGEMKKYTRTDVLNEEARYNVCNWLEKRKIRRLYGEIREWASGYFNAIVDYAENKLYLTAYEIGKRYISKMIDAFETFYDKFENKMKNLYVQQTDLERELEFINGDSIMRVCATSEILKEITEQCKQKMDDLMPEDLNAKIYNAIKQNVILDREMENDSSITDRRTDVFDQEVIKYFEKSVRDNCKDVLDKNILEAIEWECELKSLIEEKKNHEKRGDPPEDKPTRVTLDRQYITAYTKNRISEGKLLAAPGISLATFSEPRKISVSSYNDELKASRKIKFDDYIESTMGASKSVSKYELHFFEALYNITPDKLARFAAKKNRDIGVTEAGIYFDAYQDYMKGVGPDSTKSMVISPHIDKRWDTIAVMPELDMEFLDESIKRTLLALFYGLVYGLIKRRQITPFNEKKKYYQIESENGELKNFVVSNGTPCNEFYEVLDSLYRDRRVVEDIIAIAEKHRDKDSERHIEFEETMFYKHVSKLRLDFSDEVRSCDEPYDSVFAIPLLYYKSLPNSLRDDNELNLMIRSIIEAFKLEFEVFDREADRISHLTKIMNEHMDIFRKKYGEDINKIIDFYDIQTDFDDNELVKLIMRNLKESTERAENAEETPSDKNNGSRCGS